MFQRTKICSGLLLAFGGTLLSVAPGAFAQDTTVQRVEITGSSIKRVDAETSVPVTVIKADDLKKQGVTSVEQILQNVSAAQVQTTTSQVVGSGSAGASFADIRGLGANKTLVLLNGRRIANNAFDSSAPDLNMIPFAAIERVEVLRDGASSLYGTDAISGVINFITRRDYRGGTITVGMDSPQHPGGAEHSANLGFGAGDLDKDGLNVFGFVDFNKTARISSQQRPYFARTITGASATTFPGTYTAKTNVQSTDPDTGLPAVDKNGAPIYNTVTYTPFGAPGCPGSQHLFPITGTQCGEVTGDFVNLTPSTERISGLLKATLKLNESNTLGLEAFASHNRTDSIIAPVPYGALKISPTSPYYPGNGITPVPDGVTLLPGQGNIGVRFRDVFNGYREDVASNTQFRLLATLEGSVADWDYNIGLGLNTNNVSDSLVHGYSNGDIVTAGVLDGTINPFGQQTPAGLAYLTSAAKNGMLQSARGTVQTLDGHASRDLGDWFHAGRPAAIALGFEARHEDFLQHANTAYAQQVIASTGIDPNTFNAGKRDVYAGFVELDVPIIKSLDIDLSARYDKYSDFGNTTNPKASFRWQPVKSFLLRGSYSTGFRAPSLYDLNAAPAYTNTGGGQNNPSVCADGVPTPAHPFQCNNQFEALTGGNTALKPEKSKNATLGIVLEPISNLTTEFDLYNITFTNQIGSLADSTLFDASTYASFNQYFHYDSNGDLSTDGTQCPGSDCGYVDERNQNLGGVRTNGVDIVIDYKVPATSFGQFNLGYQGTYVHKYEYQDYKGGPYNQNVGVYSGAGPVFRWQHNAEVSWSMGEFALGMAGHYKSGYIDEYTVDAPSGAVDADGDPVQVNRKVSNYATFDLYGTWAMPKGFGFTVGVKNLFDRDPPFTNQQDLFQNGYDPRFTDPTGRTYYARATYSF